MAKNLKQHSSMNTPHHFKLIDGTFTPDQARQVLGAIVKSKIDFHSLNKLSETERSAQSDLSSEERLQSLRALDTELKALFKSAQASGAKLKVTGSFEIALVE
jgi:hypothetical protein